MANPRSRSPPRSRTDEGHPGVADRFPDAKAAGVVLRNANGEFLIDCQPQKKGKWSEPGGKRFPGESVMNCAKRELREETGIEATEGSTMIEWSKPT